MSAGTVSLLRSNHQSRALIQLKRVMLNVGTRIRWDSLARSAHCHLYPIQCACVLKDIAVKRLKLALSIKQVLQCTARNAMFPCQRCNIHAFVPPVLQNTVHMRLLSSLVLPNLIREGTGALPVI